ncbi:MAG: hypothetical protein PHE50_05570 [Dehalococcoidales bacterium]|nr:hypothetical protein [Dehalococcoidales bacterium]
MKKFIKNISFLLLIMTLLVTLLTGCRHSPATTAATLPAMPINTIHIFNIDPYAVPPGGWVIHLPPYNFNSHPDGIQAKFAPGDTLALGLTMSYQFKEPITFTKYTFYNRKTGEEMTIGTTEDLGPFEPGDVTIVALSHPWPVPTQPGIYEIRVYLGDENVASGVFEVKMASP